MDIHYKKLLAGNLIDKTDKKIMLAGGDKHHQRPAYRAR
jgi:hypothetical protein